MIDKHGHVVISAVCRKLLSLAAEGKDGNGLQHEKNGLFFKFVLCIFPLAALRAISSI